MKKSFLRPIFYLSIFPRLYIVLLVKNKRYGSTHLEANLLKIYIYTRFIQIIFLKSIFKYVLAIVKVYFSTQASIFQCHTLQKKTTITIVIVVGKYNMTANENIQYHFLRHLPFQTAFFSL